MARETRMPEDARKIAYDDLRKLADSSFKGDIKAAVYSLDPKVVTATVDSFGGNIDRTNRPMYLHRDKSGKITGYSTTNSGDALDRGVKPEGRFQSVLVPFVRQGKNGPEYTEDYNVAQKWYDESGQHYGKFDMDFTTPEAKARSIDRFNAASWLVHREQQLRYQPEFEKLRKQQAAKAGDAGASGSSAVPKGHNTALDGYSGPRIVINPSVFKDEKDALCVAFNECFRIIQEVNGFDPVAEPTEKQRAFFADTAYHDDERMLRRTILSRVCTFDTSVTDPTDEQLQEAVEFLDTVLEIGAPQNEWEQKAVTRIRTAITQALESGVRPAAESVPEPSGSPANAAAGGGDTMSEAEKRAANREAYLRRKLEREQRRVINNADRIADRQELLAKYENGTFGTGRSAVNALLGNSQFKDPNSHTRSVLERLERKYGDLPYAGAGGSQTPEDGGSEPPGSTTGGAPDGAAAGPTGKPAVTASDGPGTSSTGSSGTASAQTVASDDPWTIRTGSSRFGERPPFVFA